MSVRDNLIAARALIDTPERWGKGKGFMEPIGCLCAESACAAASGGDLCLRRRSWDALGAALPEPWLTLFLDRGLAPHHFNDHPETTHADIMALFDRAIEAAGDK